MGSWNEAARHYSTLDESGRRSYWLQLTAEQRIALTQALEVLPKRGPAKAPEPVIARSEPNPPMGFLRSFSFGCGGFVLGIVLTIVLQVAAVAVGIRSVKNFINEALSSGPALPDCSSPKNAEEEIYCYNENYREAKELERRNREALEGR